MLTGFVVNVFQAPTVAFAFNLLLLSLVVLPPCLPKGGFVPGLLVYLLLPFSLF
jgi:hypothetical protein